MSWRNLNIFVITFYLGIMNARAEIPKPNLSEKDALAIVDALISQTAGVANDLIKQVQLDPAGAVSDRELEMQWRGNAITHSAATSVEFWLSVPTQASVGPLPLSQSVISVTFNGDNIVVSDSSAQLEAARNGIKIPILTRTRLFHLVEAVGAAMTIVVSPRVEGSSFQSVMLCPDRAITRPERPGREGYAVSLGEEVLIGSPVEANSFAPLRSLFKTSYDLLDRPLRHFVSARFGFRGEGAVEVLSAIKPAFAEVTVQTTGQLTKAPALPDSVHAPNPRARLQYVSTPQESVLSDATDPLGAAVEFRMRSANPAGFERQVKARNSLALRKINLPRSLANAIGFGEVSQFPDWQAGECVIVAAYGDQQTLYSRKSWSLG